jgi:hypothetical protein
LYIYLSLSNCLAKLELVYVNVLKLGLKLLSSFSYNLYSLLVIAIDN